MTRFRGQPKSKSDQRNELLSAYLDGELNPSDRARLEAQLASDPALQAELDVLRRTVAMVRDLPFVPAPRNFLLPVAADRRRAPIPQPARRSWAAPLLSAATAIVSLLFVAVLAGDLLLFGAGGMASPSPAEPMLQLEAPREAPAPLAPSQEVVVEAETVVEVVPEVEGESRAGEADEPSAEFAEPSAPMPAEAAVEEVPVVTVEVEEVEVAEKEAPASDTAEDEVMEAPDATAAVGMGGGADGEPTAPPSAPGLPEEEEAPDALAVSPTATAAARAGVESAEPTPSEGPKAEPTFRAEWEDRSEIAPGALEEQPEAGMISPRRRQVSLWRVLEIILGVSALVLALATVWAWRSRPR